MTERELVTIHDGVERGSHEDNLNRTVFSLVLQSGWILKSKGEALMYDPVPQYEKVKTSAT